MEKSKKTQLLILSLITALISLTPFLYSSLRSTYLYFIINILIISLGVEAGLVSSTPSSSSSPPKLIVTSKLSCLGTSETFGGEKVKKVVRPTSENVFDSGLNINKLIKKCSSTPSIFFIGDVESEVEVDILNEEELFAKAETFIGNFYKQLKMQREESWRRIHGFYQNATTSI